MPENPLSLDQFFVRHDSERPEAAGIARAVMTGSAMASVLPVKPSASPIAFSYGKIESLGGVSERNLNENFDPVPNSVVSPKTEVLMHMGRKVEVDETLDAHDKNIRGYEQLNAGLAIGKRLDNWLFNGRRNENGKGIDGLIARCVDTQHVIAGGEGGDGGELTLDLLNDLVDSVQDFGAGRHLFGNPKVVRKIKSLVLAEAGGASLADVSSSVFTYEGISIHATSTRENGSPILPFSEVQGSSSDCTSLYCLAPGSESAPLSGVRLVTGKGGLRVIPNGYIGSFIVDVVQLSIGMVVYDRTAAARLSGIRIAA